MSHNYIHVGFFRNFKLAFAISGLMVKMVYECLEALTSPIGWPPGWVLDRTGSYSWVLLTFLPMYLASAVLFLAVKKPALPGRAPIVAVESAA